MATRREWSQEDLGNIISLEHVNVTIPDQARATLFYVLGLGLTRDPYMWVGLENMWINAGEQQFHLPTRARGQVIPGRIGLVLPDLDQLQSRLKAVEDRLAGMQFAWSVEAEGSIAVACPWGNRFRCHAPAPRFGDMVLGIPYVEFRVRPGAARGIACFYEEVMRAPASLATEPGVLASRVEVGRNQWLSFQETDEPIPPYDGHHIAIYVANVSGPYEFLRRQDRITEEVANHQFRFKDVVDPASGQVLMELEHEVRGLRHPMFRRPLVNRNPAQTQSAYAPGQDAFNPLRP